MKHSLHKLPMIVAGIDTGVGKTVVSAILCLMLKANYWKPISCSKDSPSDSKTIETLLQGECLCHKEAHHFFHDLSPHAAARRSGIDIDARTIFLPTEQNRLIIETAGGIATPLSLDALSIDLFGQWDGLWVVVSSHRLGSINHTILTITALQSRGIQPFGVIYNGTPNRESEEAIEAHTGLRAIGHLFPEQEITKQTIKKYGDLWALQRPWNDLLRC